MSVAPTGGVIFGEDINDDGTRDLWVSNRDGDEVLVFDGTSGAYLATPVTTGLGGLDDPKGLAFDPNGNLLVVDNGNDRILRLACLAGRLHPQPFIAHAVEVVADFSTVDETATGGADFISSSGTITFEPGVTTRTIVVPTIDDAIPELDETFRVSLSNPVRATNVDSEAVGTILDDGDVGNQAPTADAGADQTLSDNDGTGSEPSRSTGVALIPMVRSWPTSGPRVRPCWVTRPAFRLRWAWALIR